MKIIINRKSNFSTVNGVIVGTTKAHTDALKAIKAGKAKLIVDNEETLMYDIER